MGVLHHGHVLELVYSWTDLISITISGEYVVYGTDHWEKICGVPRISETSREVPAYGDGLDKAGRLE